MPVSTVVEEDSEDDHVEVGRFSVKNLIERFDHPKQKKEALPVSTGVVEEGVSGVDLLPLDGMEDISDITLTERFDNQWRVCQNKVVLPAAAALRTVKDGHGEDDDDDDDDFVVKEMSHMDRLEAGEENRGEGPGMTLTERLDKQWTLDHEDKMPESETAVDIDDDDDYVIQAAQKSPLDALEAGECARMSESERSRRKKTTTSWYCKDKAVKIGIFIVVGQFLSAGMALVIVFFAPVRNNGPTTSAPTNFVGDISHITHAPHTTHAPIIIALDDNDNTSDDVMDGHTPDTLAAEELFYNSSHSNSEGVELVPFQAIQEEDEEGSSSHPHLVDVNDTVVDDVDDGDTLLESLQNSTTNSPWGASRPPSASGVTDAPTFKESQAPSPSPTATIAISPTAAPTKPSPLTLSLPPSGMLGCQGYRLDNLKDDDEDNLHRLFAGQYLCSNDEKQRYQFGIDPTTFDIVWLDTTTNTSEIYYQNSPTQSGRQLYDFNTVFDDIPNEQRRTLNPAVPGGARAPDNNDAADGENVVVVECEDLPEVDETEQELFGDPTAATTFTILSKTQKRSSNCTTATIAIQQNDDKPAGTTTIAIIQEDNTATTLDYTLSLTSQGGLQLHRVERTFDYQIVEEELQKEWQTSDFIARYKNCHESHDCPYLELQSTNGGMVALSWLDFTESHVFKDIRDCYDF